MKRLLNHYQKEVMMNKIERLLQQHCPNGVEWKMLGEVAEITRGQRVTKLQLIPDGKFPVISGGIKPLGYLNNCNRETNTITIAQYGTAGYVNFITEPFWANDVCYCIFPTKVIQNKYLYYYLMNKQEFIYSLNTNAIPAHLPQDKLTNIPIPLPPLAVQEEIVRILDTFTTLETELEIALETDLNCRKKQYEYYRNKLLTFQQNEVEWKTLGEIGEFIRGTGLQKKDFTETGVPAIHYGQIYTKYGNSITHTISFVSEELAKKLKKVDKGDIVITNTSENIEDVGKAVVYLGEIQAVTGGHATIIKPSKRLLGRYLIYYTQTEMFSSQKRRYAKGTKVIDLSAADMQKITVPIPPLSEQKRIADILDKFDTLTASISEGLPKEIALRKKQYEYYREKLLTFSKNNGTV